MSRRVQILLDAIAAGGLASTVYGFHLAWPPLGWIAAGAASLVITAALASRPPRPPAS